MRDRRTLRAPVAGLLAVGLVACAGSGTTSDAEPRRSTTTSSPLPSASVSCSFPAGGPATEIALRSNPVHLVATWRLTGPIEAKTASVLTVRLGRRYELGFQRVGTDLSRFVYDTRTRRQTNLLDPYAEVPDRATLTVPARDLSQLPGPVPWSATVSVDGRDVARCPAAGTTRTFPPTTRKSKP
jgi:hypothetical protein